MDLAGLCEEEALVEECMRLSESIRKFLAMTMRSPKRSPLVTVMPYAGCMGST